MTSKCCKMHPECRGEGHAGADHMTPDARREMARACFQGNPEVRRLQLTRKREERRRLHECHTSALVPVNPGQREEPRARWSYRSCHLFVLWFGQMGSTYLMVWSYGLEDALEEAAAWCADHAPGLLAEDSYEEAYKEAIEEGKTEEEAWEDAEADMTYTESGHLHSEEWGIWAENPSREELISLRDRLTPTSWDYDQGRFQARRSHT